VAAAATKRKADKAAGRLDPHDKLGSLTELFGDPVAPQHDRRNAPGLSEVVGSGESASSPRTWFRIVFNEHFNEVGTAARLSGAASRRSSAIKGNWWSGVNSLLLNTGAFFGIYFFSRITATRDAKPRFAMSFVAAMLTTHSLSGT